MAPPEPHQPLGLCRARLRLVGSDEVGLGDVNRQPRLGEGVERDRIVVDARPLAEVDRNAGECRGRDEVRLLADRVHRDTGGEEVEDPVAHVGRRRRGKPGEDLDDPLVEDERGVGIGLVRPAEEVVHDARTEALHEPLARAAAAFRW